MSAPWFGAKSYGIGFTPKSPAGWACMLGYVAAAAGLALSAKRFDAPPWIVVLAVLALSVVLIVLTVVKGDHQPIRWRWGGR